MGRYYKTASPEYLDYMYELPQEAILKAVQTADSGITANTAANDALKGLLKLNAIKNDQPDADRILSGYESQIDTISKEIQANPLEYRRKNSSIGDLQRTMAKDFTSGEAAMIQGNYNTRAANYEAMKEDYKKNPEKYNYQDIEKLQGLLDTGYGGYKKGGYGVDRLREFVDLKDFDKLGKDYEADIIEKTGAFKGNDGMLYTSESKDKRVDPNQIRKDMVGILMNDKKLNDYYGQQMKLGNLSQDDYYKQLATTADRIAEKYGYKETKDGLTSIKNDDKDTADHAFMLANAVTNATPDTIADESLVGKYSPEGKEGPQTVNELVNTINAVSGKVQEVKNTMRDLAHANNIIIKPEIMAELKQGNFKILKGVKGQNGEKISNQEIYDLQRQHDDLNFERKILKEKNAIAATHKNPEEYLNKTAKSVLNVIGDYQKFGIVDKKDEVVFTKAVKSVQEELKNSQAYYAAPLKFSQEDISKLPQGIRQKLKDGNSINQLVADGLIKVKQVEAGEKVLTGKSGTPMGTEKIYSQGTEFQNFKVDGSHAKPTTTDGKGGSLWQFEVNLQGHPIRVYLEDKHLQNKGISQYMNRDAMKATSMYQRAHNEGVITKEGFDIQGINFEDVNGTSRAVTGHGSVPIETAIMLIANKIKSDRNKILQ